MTAGTDQKLYDFLELNVAQDFFTITPDNLKLISKIINKPELTKWATFHPELLRDPRRSTWQANAHKDL